MLFWFFGLAASIPILDASPSAAGESHPGIDSIQTITSLTQGGLSSSSEPRLADLLKDMGYDDSVIGHPLSPGLFQTNQQPSVTIVQKNGNARITFGWYREDPDQLFFEELIHEVTGPASTKPFAPGVTPFGFYIHVEFQESYQWYTETARNGGEVHVKMFPLVKAGAAIPDSYLLCWEDLPLGAEEIDDYQDILIQVSNVTPVRLQTTDEAGDDLPRLTFGIWGSTPFSSQLTANRLNQRILFTIRKEPKSAEIIAREIKAATDEIMRSLKELSKHDLVRLMDGSAWVTNFPIATQEEFIKANQIGLKYARIEAEILRNQIPKLKDAYARCQVSRYHPWPETSLIIVGALCADFCVSDRIRFLPKYFNEKYLPPLHPDGQRWGYEGEEILSSPLPFRKYQFYQNVWEDPEGGLSRFGYFKFLDEKRISPPSNPENLRSKPAGLIFLSLPIPLTLGEIQKKTTLDSGIILSTIEEMRNWSPPGLIKENDRYRSVIPIFSTGDLEILLPEADRAAEIIFREVTVPMENELEEEAKRLGLRFPLNAGTSARDIALQILSEEGSISPIAQPPVSWNFGLWGWNGHLPMWEDLR
ncbi:MAG: hypothetical protein ACE15F_11845 [bacterium]